MIKRILNYDKQDWKHIGWLFKGVLESLFITFNLHEAKECLIFIKIHLMYDSNRVD